MQKQFEKPGSSGTAAVRSVLSHTYPSPLPHADSVELEMLSIPGRDLEGVVVDTVQLDQSRAALMLYRFQGGGAAATVHAMAARAHTLRHLLAGAEPHTALACTREALDKADSPQRFDSGCVAMLDLNDNRISFSFVGAFLPCVVRRGSPKPLSLTDLRSVRTKPVGARLDDYRVHLGRGDWFIMVTEAFETTLSRRSSDPSQRAHALTKALSRATATRLIARVRTHVLNGSGRSSESHDVAAIALRVPPGARRFRIIERLGFQTDEPVRLEFLHYFEEMDHVVSGVLRCMDYQGYADSAIRRMKVALAELLVNALEHGNGRDPSKAVTVGYIVDGHAARVSVMDEGRGFDPTEVPDPTLEGNLLRERGRGLFLARSFVDEMTFNEKGNRATVTTRFCSER